MEYIFGFFGIALLLGIIGRVWPAFNLLHRASKGLSMCIGKAFKPTGLHPKKVTGQIISMFMVSLFVIPLAFGIKFLLGFLVDVDAVHLGDSRFTYLAYVMIAFFVVSLVVAYGQGSEAISFWGATFNTAGAMTLWNGSTSLSISAVVLAGSSFVVYWSIAGTTPQSKALARDNRNQSAKGETSSGIQNRAVKPRYTFANVAGMTEVKADMLKAGKAIIGSKSEKNGILFFGPPGNGKTFLGEALAGELKLPFIAASFGNIASQWVGQTTRNAMQLFDDAEAQAPCMLFLDEIDSVFIDRSKVANADSEAPKTLNAILTRLVDIRGKGVVVVGATNFIDRLDSASIREGRFDFKVEITAPDYEARFSLLKSGLKGLPSSTATLESVSRRWEGFSVSRIRAIADKAVEMAHEKHLVEVDFDFWMQALRKVQGSKGDKLRENTPDVSQLTLSGPMRDRLEKIVMRMKNIEDVERFGGSAPTGVIFIGPPGTGKTLGAMAVAKSSGWAFISTSGNELLGDPDNIDKLMARASDIRPCIIFIDEADDVLANRKMSPMSKSVTNRLLSVMDGAGGRAKDILFIAATNHPEMLDEAMMRGGRFTEKIEFSLPGDSVVREYVAKWIAKTKAPLAEDFTVEAVTQLLAGQSMANINEMLQGAINEAIVRISSRPGERVRLQDLKDAMRLIDGE